MREDAYGPLWGLIATSMLGGVWLAEGMIIQAVLCIFTAAVFVKLALDAMAGYAWRLRMRRTAEGYPVGPPPPPPKVGSPEEFSGIVTGPADLKAGDVLEGRPVLEVPTDWMRVADDLFHALVAVRVQHAFKCDATVCEACKRGHKAHERYEQAREE